MHSPFECLSNLTVLAINRLRWQANAVQCVTFKTVPAAFLNNSDVSRRCRYDLARSHALQHQGRLDLHQNFNPENRAKK